MADVMADRHPLVFRLGLIQAGSQAFARRFYASKRGVTWLVILLLLAAGAVLAPVISGTNPSAVAATGIEAPSAAHIMGTDNIGRDIFSLVLYGTRYSLATGILAAVVALALGALIGSVAGYFRGASEWLLMRVVDLFQMFPAIVLALFVIALLGSNFWLVVLVIGAVIWPLEARIVYGQFMILREQNFVQAAKVAGIARRRIVVGEILPNALPPVIVQVALDAGLAILIQAALGFLGLGNPNQPSWGELLYIAQDYLQSAWWMSVFPGICIFLAVMAFSLLGDGLNEMYNPLQTPSRRGNRGRYHRLSVMRGREEAAHVP